MLSKLEQQEKNKAFWGGFKNRIKKHMSANGRRINWLNYPTQVKDLYVRLYADGNYCALNFDIQCKDEGVCSIVWEQMGELKKVLNDTMGEEGEWIEEMVTKDGVSLSRIIWKRDDLNYYNTSDIPEIYKFLEQKIRSFDVFYQEYKEILLNLLN